MPDDPNANPGDKGNAGSGDNGQPKYVTVEQLNAAIASKLGEHAKKQEGAFKGLLESFASGIDKTLDEKLQAWKPQTPPDKGGEGGKNEPGIDQHPMFRSLKKQLDDQGAKLKASEDRAAAEAAKVRDRDLRTALGDALGKVGVKDPARLKRAIGALVDQDKRVKWSEDGESIVFDDANGALELGVGLADWAKSDDAKIFLSPTGAGGSGDRNTGKNPPAPQKGYQRGQMGRDLLAFAQAGGVNLQIGGKPPAKTG